MEVMNENAKRAKNISNEFTRVKIDEKLISKVLCTVLGKYLFWTFVIYNRNKKYILWIQNWSIYPLGGRLNLKFNRK